MNSNKKNDRVVYEQCTFCELIQCPNRTAASGCPALVFEHGKPVMIEKKEA